MSQQEMLRRAGLSESLALAVLTNPNTLPTEPNDLIAAADARLGPIVIPRFSGHTGKVSAPIQRRHKQRDTAPKVDRAKAKTKRKAAKKARKRQRLRRLRREPADSSFAVKNLLNSLTLELQNGFKG